MRARVIHVSGARARRKNAFGENLSSIAVANVTPAIRNVIGHKTNKWQMPMTTSVESAHPTAPDPESFHYIYAYDKSDQVYGEIGRA